MEQTLLCGPQANTTISLYTYETAKDLNLNIQDYDLVQVFGKEKYYVSAKNESYDRVIEFLANTIVQEIQAHQAHSQESKTIYFAVYPTSDNLHVAYVRCTAQEWEPITPQEALDLGLEHD